jgi:hypothetical protein
MTDLSQLVRWNAGFVRGLAESVLNRAKSIRTTLTAYGEEPVKSAAAKTPAKKRGTSTAKKTTAKRAPARRKKTDA